MTAVYVCQVLKGKSKQVCKESKRCCVTQQNRKFRSISLSNDLIVQVEDRIKENTEYSSIADFVTEATRLRLQSTEIYTHLIHFENEEWTVRRPRTAKEEDALIEAGFQFVRFDEREGCAIYRKRK